MPFNWPPNSDISHSQHILSTAFSYICKTQLLLNHVILLFRIVSQALAWHVKPFILSLYFLSCLRFCFCHAGNLQFLISGDFLFYMCWTHSATPSSQHPLSCHQWATAHRHPASPQGASQTPTCSSSLSLLTSLISTPSVVWMPMVLLCHPGLRLCKLILIRLLQPYIYIYLSAFSTRLWTSWGFAFSEHNTGFGLW